MGVVDLLSLGWLPSDEMKIKGNSVGPPSFIFQKVFVFEVTEFILLSEDRICWYLLHSLRHASIRRGTSTQDLNQNTGCILALLKSDMFDCFVRHCSIPFLMPTMVINLFISIRIYPQMWQLIESPIHMGGFELDGATPVVSWFITPSEYNSK